MNAKLKVTMTKLLEQGGGSIVTKCAILRDDSFENKRQKTYIVIDTEEEPESFNIPDDEKDLKDIHWIHRGWIIDSVASCRLKSLDDYIYSPSL